jgi:hypothetical protein
MLTILTTLVLSTAAHAAIYAGNPEMTIKVDRAAHDFATGDVELWKFVVHSCGGGALTYYVNDAIDPVAGWVTHIQGGDLCGITLYWNSSMLIDGSGGAFTIAYTHATTEVSIGATIPSVALSPVQVISGSYSGGSPALWLKLD